jgi:hypothetical protein
LLTKMFGGAYFSTIPAGCPIDVLGGSGRLHVSGFLKR